MPYPSANAPMPIRLAAVSSTAQRAVSSLPCRSTSSPAGIAAKALTPK